MKSSSTPNKPSSSSTSDSKLAYGKSQYKLIILGFLLIVVGLALSAGGHNDDPNVFDPDVIYNKRITILAPIVILSGLIVEIFAIFKKK